jgi:membrane-associated protease RseP (regulator of RpoE activity)
MRMFVGVAATLTLASGVALAAAGLGHNTQQPGVWVSKDGARTAVVAEDLTEDLVAIDEDDALDDQVRQLAVLAGRGAQLGVSVRDLDAEQAKGQSGAVVEDVRAGSAAEKAGIKKGDVIAEFDGERVRGVRHLTRLVTETPDGRTVKTAVLREGKRVDLSVTPDSGTLASADRNFELLVPPRRFEKKLPHDGGDMTWAVPRMPDGAWAFKGRPGELFGFKSEKGRLGVRVQELDGQLAEYFGTPKGVLVSSVDADSPAAKAGLKAGDVITAVNGKAVAEPSDLIEVVQGVDDGATLTVDYTRDKKAQSAKAALPAREPAELPRKRQSARPI